MSRGRVASEGPVGVAVWVDTQSEHCEAWGGVVGGVVGGVPRPSSKCEDVYGSMYQCVWLVRCVWLRPTYQVGKQLKGTV